jgi:hypothetical protein
MTDTPAGSRQTPWHLWLVGGLALVWNGSGVLLWGGTTFTPDTFLTDLPTDHRAYVNSLPLWSTLTWGLGVLGGASGSILLLLRHRMAVPAFALSLFGAAANTMVYATNTPPAGFFNPGLTVFINLFALFQLWYAHDLKRRRML